MGDVETLFQLITMKLDDIEEFVDKLEDAKENVKGIRTALAKVWDEIDEIS